MVKLREFFPSALQGSGAEAPRVFRFEIFKGQMHPSGILERIRPVGSARLTEGYRTYVIQLKALLHESFYLLPERQDGRGHADYAVLTREDSQIPGRRFFWNKVGEGILLPPPNTGVLHLCWDIFGASDIYMSMTPEPGSAAATAAAASAEAVA